jgi:hypothetical protein
MPTITSYTTKCDLTLAGATCCGCCVLMSATTTSSGRTAAWRWLFPSRGTRTRDLMPIRLPEVRRRDVLSGLIHEYHRVAA